MLASEDLMHGKPSRVALFKQLQKTSNADLPALTILRARRLLAYHPNHGPTWLVLGIALVELARYEEAEAALRKAVKLCPPDRASIPLGHMGHLFREQGAFDRAAEWYRKASEAAPTDSTGYIYLGGALAKAGRLREAEEVHRAAIECVEGCIDEAFLNLGLVLRAQERFTEAAECFREAIHLDPAYHAAKKALRDVERCLKHLA